MRSGIGPQGHLRVRAVNQQPQRIRFNSAASLRLAYTKPTDHNSFSFQLTHLPAPCSQQRAGRRHSSSRRLAGRRESSRPRDGAHYNQVQVFPSPAI